MPILTIIHKVPALDRLVDFLESERDQETIQALQGLTSRLKVSSDQLAAAIQEQPQP